MKNRSRSKPWSTLVAASASRPTSHAPSSEGRRGRWRQSRRRCVGRYLKAVVVALLWAGCGHHGNDDRPILPAAESLIADMLGDLE